MRTPATFPADNRLRTIIGGSPILTTILNGWSSIALPDCWLSGSAIAQTAWNAAFGLSSEYGLADWCNSTPQTFRRKERRPRPTAFEICFPIYRSGSTPRTRPVFTSGINPSSAILLRPTIRTNRLYQRSRRRLARSRSLLRVMGWVCRSSHPSGYRTCLIARCGLTKFRSRKPSTRPRLRAGETTGRG